MKKIFNIICTISMVCGFASCSDFLDEHIPQGTLSEEQVKSTENAEAMVVSAYAIFTTAEDINSSFSMWNFDVRSDDAYKGGNGTSDGDVFHQLEIQQGVLTTNWNIRDMWERLYKCISRVNSAIALLNACDDSFTMKQQRLAEMKFLRAYAHFLLKRLYKYIPYVVDENLSTEEYYTLSNRTYTNDEGWQVIINDLMEAYNTLPAVQADKVIPATGKWPDANYEIGLPFHAQGSDFHQVWWGTGTERGYNTGSAYTFSKGTCDGENELDEDEMLALPTKENSIKFMTLPYDVDFDGGIITEGQDAHSYVLKNIDTDPENYKVELTEQFAFKAGEPFILVTGDPQPLVTESQDSTNIYVDPAYLNADGYDFNAVTENATLLLSKETETYYIPGHGAYINPTLVADAGGKADKVIGGLIDAIKPAVAEKEDAVVNVFTADGKLVKSGVKRSQAKAGLAKGIYLIGKNKVMVR